MFDEEEYDGSEGSERESREYEERSGEEISIPEDEDRPLGYKETIATTSDQAVGKRDVYDSYVDMFIRHYKDGCSATLSSEQEDDLKIRIRNLPNILNLNIELLVLAACFHSIYGKSVNKENVTKFINGYKKRHNLNTKKVSKKQDAFYDPIDIIRYIRFYTENI